MRMTNLALSEPVMMITEGFSKPEALSNLLLF